MSSSISENILLLEHPKRTRYSLRALINTFCFLERFVAMEGKLFLTSFIGKPFPTLVAKADSWHWLAIYGKGCHILIWHVTHVGFILSMNLI